MPEQRPDPSISITIEGKKAVQVRLRSFTGRETKDFRSATATAANPVGFPPMAVFSDPKLLDLDVIAAFLWITRRRQKPTLTYDEILDSMSYENTEVELNLGDEDGSDEDDGPEA